MFRPKLIQTLVDNGVQTIDFWKNGRLDGQGIDVLKDQLFVNMISRDGRTENTDFKFLPSDSINASLSVLQRLEKQAQIGSGLPEIFYPYALTGNMASSGYQVQQGIDAIKSIQREQTVPYQKLIKQELEIRGYMDGYRYSEDIEVVWDDFDMLTPSERIDKFQGFASGLSTLMSANAISKDMAFYFAKKFYSDIPHDTSDDLMNAMKNWFEEFKAPENDIFDSGFGADLL